MLDLPRNPQGRVRVKQDNTNHQSPSPLMEEESKARVKQDNTTINITSPLMGEG